jgi:hypothetical protein
MSFFELVQVAVLSGVGLAAVATLGVAIIGYRRDRSPRLEGDSRDETLVLHGEFMRRTH